MQDIQVVALKNLPHFQHTNRSLSGASLETNLLDAQSGQFGINTNIF